MRKNKNLSIFRRAALAVALLFFIFQSDAAVNEGGKKNKDRSISVRDSINKAQELLLQKNRIQASQVLIAALQKEKEGAKSSAFVDLTKALKKASEMFFSEKTQQSYELALATYVNDKAQSVDKLRETLQLESSNTLILKALIFTLLAQKECLPAKKIYDDLQKMNPFDEELEKLRFLQLVCTKNKAEALALLAKSDSLFLNQGFIIVNKQRLLGESSPQLLQEPQGISTDYPELIYILWLMEKKPKERITLADKYKQLCHTPMSFDRAYGWGDPWVCDHLKEINDFLSS